MRVQPRVLVVDDDAPLREVVRYALERAGFVVDEASDGRAALDRLATHTADLLVLDVAMPRLDGLGVCRELRSRPDGGPPIIFLTARDDEVDRVLGLELGGDDYVTKPFSPRELASRVRAVLRRTRPEPSAEADEALQSGPVRVDLGQRRVWVDDVEVTLTATEFDLLRALLARPGRVYTREELVQRVYGDGWHVSDRTIDSHLRRVRQKLGEAGSEGVRTVHGVGYRFAHEDA
ncbi:MAG: response regulator transcription factor [Alphaproteobacteria bacterium]|nr:response regulator transcription factor [Alphaproteobacteria bacterium]